MKAIERGDTRAPARRLASRRRLLPRLVAAAVLLGLLGAAWFLFGPVILRYAANEGELVIVINDPQVQAVVDQAGMTIRDRARQRAYKVEAGRNKWKSGEYVLEVTEAGSDVRLFTKEFTITRGGRASVTVTLDPKALARAAAARDGKPVGKTVFWTGNEAHVFVDPAHALTDVLDFRDLAGATPDQFRDWLAKLGGFRLTLLNSHEEAGQPLLNAVAVREDHPRPVKFLAEMSRQVDEPNYERMTNDGFHPLFVCDYARQGQTVTSQLWSRRSLWCLWSGPLPFIERKLKDQAAKGRRPIFLHGPAPAGGGPRYRAVGANNPGRKWNVDYRLPLEELASIIASCRDRGWRPDVLAPHQPEGRLRMMLVTLKTTTASIGASAWT
jgi:hypothetical protein